MMNEALPGSQTRIPYSLWYPVDEKVSLEEVFPASRDNLRHYACVHNRTLAVDSSLIEFVLGFSPLIEVVGHDTVVLDIAGTETLFGEPEHLAQEILDHLSRNSIDASVSVASNPDAAILSARNLPGITILDSSEDRRLCELPLAALDPILAGVRPERVNDILETLDLWGLHTLGDLARLPEKGVAETLGPDGIALRQLALGVHKRPLNFTKAKIAFEESLDLEYPIGLLDQFSFAVSTMMEMLCSRLSSYGLATSAIALVARLEDSCQYERRLGFPFPITSARWISRLLLFDIESSPPGAAIKHLKISAEPARPRSVQEGLFEPLAPEPEKLEMTLARLGRLVGRENIGSPEVLDDHYPDAFRIKSFTLAAKKRRLCRSNQNLNRASDARSFQNCRSFRPPLSAKVESESGRLTLLKFQEDQVLRDGRIIRESGPWRVSGRWWSDADRWDREEWDVTLSNGLLYKVFRDRASDQWCVDGIYD